MRRGSRSSRRMRNRPTRTTTSCHGRGGATGERRSATDQHVTGGGPVDVLLIELDRVDPHGHLRATCVCSMPCCGWPAPRDRAGSTRRRLTDRPTSGAAPLHQGALPEAEADPSTEHAAYDREPSPALRAKVRTVGRLLVQRSGRSVRSHSLLQVALTPVRRLRSVGSRKSRTPGYSAFSLARRVVVWSCHRP